jgi:uncharacterized protein (TIGR03118 family)
MTSLLGTWLKAMKRKAALGAGARRGAKHRRPHRTVPRLEVLEDRVVPSQNGYVQMNLVSDLASQNAQITDPNMKNPWGISESASGLFSISDQKANVSTQYAVTAAGVSQGPLTVAIPTGATPGHGPTGQVYNDTSSFLVNGAPASFIFANLNGTISAWNSSASTLAQVKATTTGAVYTGLVIQSTASGDFLYAADAKQGRIDVFDSSFNGVPLPSSAFVDPQLPAGLLPFNVEDVNGDLYVAYAKAGPPAAKAAAPEGSGAIAVFDTSGKFIRQLTAGGKLASPWGITLAPTSFGEFGGDLLVGNFSYVATEINAFDPVSGAYQGTLADENGNTLLAGDNGLWDLTFGNGGNGGLADTLYFATGLNAETDGLFGAIIPTPENGNSHGAIVGIQPIGLLGGNGLGSGALGGGPTSAATPSLKIEASPVVDNGATVSVAATGGSAGRGIGRVIHVTTNAVAEADVLTATDDVFATLAQR